MNRSSAGLAIPLGVALAAVALQLGATLVGRALGYGYFIDELYYVACARRLDFGYVDHPPLAPAILRLNLALLGESLLSIRLPSALAGGRTRNVRGRLRLWLAEWPRSRVPPLRA